MKVMVVIGIVVSAILLVPIVKRALYRIHVRIQARDEGAPSTIETCAFTPATAGYAPCTREKGHEGPCAHPLAEKRAREKS